jgi:phasin family protein
MNVNQFSGAAKASIDTLFGLNNRALESVEQLAALNVQTVKTALAESAESFQEVLSAKRFDELLKLQTASLRAAPQKAAAYGRQVREILTTLAAEQRAALEAGVSAVQAQVLEGLTGAFKNAASADKAQVLVKSAFAAANNAYKGVNKASRQVSEVTAANVAKVTEAAQGSALDSREMVTA